MQHIVFTVRESTYSESELDCFFFLQCRKRFSLFLTHSFSRKALQRTQISIVQKRRYFRGAPPNAKTKAGAPTAEPKIYNTFVLFTRDHAGGTTSNTIARDAAALAESLQSSKSIPRAIGRLAGVYDLDGKIEGPRYSYDDEDEDDCHENLNRSSFCSRLFGAGGSISRNNSEEDKSMLYFGLASNAEQRTTVKLLEKNGCCT